MQDGEEGYEEGNEVATIPTQTKHVTKRPVPIDWEKFDELLSIGCIGREIAAYFGLSLETIYELKDCVKHFNGNCVATSIHGIEHAKMLECNKCPTIMCKSIVNSMAKERCPSYIQTKNILTIKNKLDNLSENK